jgi:hypothetical protein
MALHRDAAMATPRASRRPGPVTTTRVNAQVWALALSYARGDARRITEREPMSVLVVNRPS